MTRAAAVLLLVVGCGGSTAKPPVVPTPERGLENAALPYRVLRARGGEEISRDELLVTLRQADAVCLGERHPNPHDHWLQLDLWKELAAGDVALGLEMFQLPFQGVLYDYASGRIDEATMLARTAWADRWGYDFALYRPILEVALDKARPLLALNAPREIVRKVGRQGLEALSTEEKASLPQLVLDDAAHRAYFKAATEGHEMSAAGFEAFYTAQVIWDETMADTAARWLKEGAGRRIVILAGHGHCHDRAVPERLRRRGVAKVVSLRAVIDDGKGNVAEALAAPEGDYLVVMEMPAR
jgi:uncharacterized iron-regulated protein